MIENDASNNVQPEYSSEYNAGQQRQAQLYRLAADRSTPIQWGTPRTAFENQPAGLLLFGFDRLDQEPPRARRVLSKKDSAERTPIVRFVEPRYHFL